MAVTSKSLHRTLVASTILVFPAIVYAVTLYCAATSTYRYSPLGLVSPKHGILILNILSKAGDVALATAADSAWSAIKFMVTFRRSPTSLSTVFALSSGIGWLGLTGIMTQRRVFRALDQRTWAFLRLFVILLLPGPGIIIMSEINVQSLYFPTQFSPISGGMGVFNTSLIRVFQEASGPVISALVQNILRDPSISYVTQSVSSSCKASDASCSSYLLPGGVQTVSPWPVNSTAPELSAYVVEGGPSYLLEFGSLSADVSWNSDACKIYASTFASKTIPLQLCIQNATSSEMNEQIYAGWRVCPTSLDDSGNCNQAGSWDASLTWNTSLTIYRCNATVAASRTNLALLQVRDLGTPVLQSITPRDLFQVYDAILTPLDNISDGGNCSSLTPQSQLTEFLYIYLNQSAYTTNPIISTQRDYLRNLLAVPLYYCNSVMILSSNSPNAVQPGLLPENYLRGSYAIPEERAVPESWTVWTYAGLYGAILLLLLAVHVAASGYETSRDSHFPIADLLIQMSPEEMSYNVGEAGKQSSKVQFDELFAGVAPGDDQAIMRRASEIRMRLVHPGTT
ncbi:uncharacterized protein BHQ10_004339 [Talaromyces amestolkiae]|uniref:Uncharacterized protein n=1 Tax=Talaromyces amestolkiae TaxID=1196081 RepID=A0A364KXP4_TALAM|nr:uncharacterized protein BHQ10_004339 [Talaromyces amestolkiae]RAO68327.1 hypothetical protein BHQ10_004339 [Talaromyces amestolkiae]